MNDTYMITEGTIVSNAIKGITSFILAYFTPIYSTLAVIIFLFTVDTILKLIVNFKDKQFKIHDILFRNLKILTSILLCILVSFALEKEIINGFVSLTNYVSIYICLYQFSVIINNISIISGNTWLLNLIDKIKDFAINSILNKNK